jgi:hypothetical protein
MDESEVDRLRKEAEKFADQDKDKKEQGAGSKRTGFDGLSM